MGLSHVVPQLMQRIWAAHDDADVVVYSPEHRRASRFAADAARLAALALESPRAPALMLNLGNVEPEVTMTELAGRIARVVGRKVKIVPGTVTAGSPVRRQPDIARLISLTGSLPEIGLDEGLGLTFDWYRANLWERPCSALTS